MRVLIILFVVFFCATTHAQITISGTKNASSSSNKNSTNGEVNRTPVEVTKTRTEEKKYVILNQIENSNIESSENAVIVNITRNGASSNVSKPRPGEGEMDFNELKKQIIIDLGPPKVTKAPVNGQGKPMIVVPNNKNTSTTSGIFILSEKNIPATELVTTPVVETPKTNVTPTELVTTPTVTQPVAPKEPITTNPTIVENVVIETPTPEVSENVVAQPVVTKPVVTQPEVNTQPTITEPVVTQPVITQPVVTQPVITEPVITEPTITETTPRVTTPVVPTAEVPITNTNGVAINTNSSQTNPSVTTNVAPLTTNPVASNETPKIEVKESEKSEFPKKNNKMWGVGFNAGLPMVFGDVRSELGYGGSLMIQKSLGHVFSLRMQTLFAETYGQDWKLQDGEPDYKNYKSRLSDYTLQGVFSINNINFYKRQPKVILNLIAGAGFSTRFTWTNLTDENGNFYNYSDVPAVGDKDDRREALDVIKEKLDEGYETAIVSNKLEGHIKDTDINPTVVLGMGIGFRISKRVDLNIEQRMSWHNSDILDGYVTGNGNDWLSYTSLGLNFKIGKAEEAMWWMNPVYTTYDDINDLKKKVDEGDLLKDEDKDGVADIFDKDLNTPEKVAVDTRGVASDLDKDGVPDYLDAEPFTPIGADVDANGKAIDTDGDGVPDVYDMEMSTPANAYVDANGRQISGGGGAGYPGGGYSGGSYSGASGETFGMIHFDLNSTTIKKEFYSELYKVVAFLRDNPNQKVVITGYTDLRNTESYNMGLSEQRANEVYRMLTEVFKVLSTKLEIRYEGENNALVPGLPDPANPKYEAAYYLNRRVTFRVK